MTSDTSSVSITIYRSNLVAAGALWSRPLIASILCICFVRIFFCVAGRIVSNCSNGSLYVCTKCQISVSKTVLCIPLYISASKVKQKTLPPAQLSKECFTVVAASNKHSGVTSSVEWDVSGCLVKLPFEFSNMDFPIMPSSERCRHIFSSM